MKTPGHQVMGDAIGPLIDLGVTEADLALQQRRPFGVAQCGLFETPAQATGLLRILDVGNLHALDHAGNGFGDSRQLAEHHAPGDGVVRRAAHVAPVRSSYCRAAMTDPENTSTVLELYTRFLKCFVVASRHPGDEPRYGERFHPVAGRPRKMQDARWPFMQIARNQKSHLILTY
jgi:hypothetical protein